jgi:hypothetical protein
MSTEKNARDTVAYWTGVIQGPDAAAQIGTSADEQTWFKLGCAAHPAAQATNAVLGTIFITWLTSWLKGVFGIKK